MESNANLTEIWGSAKLNDEPIKGTKTADIQKTAVSLTDSGVILSSLIKTSNIYTGNTYQARFSDK
jgi:hypothetical protein